MYVKWRDGTHSPSFHSGHGTRPPPQAGSCLFEHSSSNMAMEASAQLVNLSVKAELKLVEAVAAAMPSGQVRFLRVLKMLLESGQLPEEATAVQQ